MTAEEVLCRLDDKYGGDFNWRILPPTNQTFLNELKREVGKDLSLYGEEIRAVAKCDSNDDVLFLSGRKKDGKDIYYIFHLTWQTPDISGFPHYKEFIGIDAVEQYLENLYLTEYL